MGLEFLARVRRTSIALGLVAGLMATTYSGPARGLALLAGCAWCLINLLLIETLIVAVTGDERGTQKSLKRSIVSVTGMVGLFAAGAFLALRLPPTWLLAGFGIPFAVIVLKAASLMLLPTRLWRRLTSSPWRATALVVVLAVGAWAASGALTRPPAASAKSSASLPAEHPASDSLRPEAHDDASGATREHTEHAAGTAAGAHASEGEEAAHAEGHEESGPQKFANVITVLSRAFPHAPWAHFLHQFEAVIFALLVAAILAFVAFLASRNPQMIPGPLQNLVEMVVESLNDFVTGILGAKHGPRYVPFLGSLFVYIMAMNLFGLIPFMDSPTSNLNVTFALALVVFLYAQYIGFKELGVVGYFDHMLGSPRSAISWAIAPIMFPIHLMGELAKPISLSCRLFGNIFGEDMLLVAFATLGVTVLSATGLPFGLPLHLPFLFLALLTSTLQALVFTVLTTIYFLLMLPHDDHAHEGEEAHAH